jgi:hypothetical protein
MKSVNKIFIHLFIVNIYIVSIYSYDDNDVNEILHEKLFESSYKRVRRDVGNETIIAYDGSGDTSSESI